MEKRLREAGLPTTIIMMIMRINKSSPVLPEEELLDESRHKQYKSLELVLDFADEFEYDSLQNDTNRFTKEGVAQGTAIGPILAAYCLIPFFSQMKSLSYADDGLFFSTKPIKLILDPVMTGLRLNQDKSGYIKYNNI